MARLINVNGNAGGTRLSNTGNSNTFCINSNTMTTMETLFMTKNERLFHLESGLWIIPLVSKALFRGMFLSYR